jgi:hypothetical protein
MSSALAGNLRASPSSAPDQAPCGVGCHHRPSHEPQRDAPRLHVRPFPTTTTTPAGTTTSADLSTANGALTSAAVHHHPANQTDKASRTPMEISLDKTNNLHRTPTAFTQRPLDDIGLRRVRQARPDRHAFYAIPVRWVAISPPASSPPRLTTEQLPSACGWCHQPPQGTRTPELLVMPGVPDAARSAAPPLRDPPTACGL